MNQSAQTSRDHQYEEEVEMWRTPRKLVVLSLIVAALAATAATAGADRVAGGKLEFDAKNHTLENLAELGIQFEITGEATFAGAGVRFLVDDGDINPNADFKGIVEGRGGLLFSRDEYNAQAAATFKNPSIVIANNKARLVMSVNGEPLRVATLRGCSLTGNDKAFHLDAGRASFSQAGAKALRDTFDVSYPDRGIPLGTFDIKAKLAGATVAAGATTEPSQISAYGPGLHGEPGGVGIRGGPDNNEIAVSSPAPSTVVVSDKNGATAEQGCHQSGAPGTYSCGCESIDTTSVNCNTPYGMDIGVGLMDGDDTIRVLAPMVVRATGGRGADRLTGNALDDYLRGDEGRDRLSGDAGKDEIFSGRGHDFAYGGGGNDLLWVRDRDRDRVIDCGRGNDRAFIDRKLDPEPLRCEHVRFGPLNG